MHSPEDEPLSLSHPGDVPEYQLAKKDWVGPHGTLSSIIKAQRRITGRIVSVEAGSARIASEYGEFPFNLSSVKTNKKYPDRVPQAGDKCEFKVSDANPPKATSIRVAVPKYVTTVGQDGLPAEGASSLGGGSSYADTSSSIGTSAAFGTSGPFSSGLDDLCYSLKTEQWVSPAAASAGALTGSNKAPGGPIFSSTQPVQVATAQPPRAWDTPSTRGTSFPSD